MREHDEHGAVEPRRGEAEDAQHNKSQVADGGVGDQLLHVRLHHRNQRTVNDSDQRQCDDPWSIAAGLVGKQSEVEAQHAVGAHLQQNAGEQNGSGRGCFYVCVRQPGVEREQRNFDGEGYKKSQEEPRRGGREVRDLMIGNGVADGDEIEAAGLRVEPEDCR